VLYMQAMQDINVGGRLSKTQFQFTLRDTDITELNAWGPKILARLQALPGLADVTSDQQSSAPRLMVRVNRDAAARVGVTPSAIDETLYDAFGQRQVSTIYGALNQYHVVLEVDPRFQLAPDALDRIYVKAGDGTLVPLSAVTTLESGTAPLSINHQDGFPAVTISFNLMPGTALGQAVQEIRQAMQQIGAPPTVQAAFQGTAQAFQKSLSSEPVLIAASLVAIYIILAMLYESVVHPLTIISTLPSAGLGALLTLMLFHQDLTVMGIIGIILLMGIVKKNGIMLVDFALEAERHQGKAPEVAMFEACVLRFRPILMTTMAAMLGGIPLALGTGAGTELRRPLGLAIVGGLLVSQVLTLYTTPVIYLYLDGLSRWLKLRRRTPRLQAALTAES
jgi:multidrug efflux pump subunit AcrB